MAEITETFLVQVEHTAGSFLAQISEQSETLAINAVIEWATARRLDVEDAWIATEADIEEAQGQMTEVDVEV